jgi:ABC-type dipeptide/oligopeptide/nickel transport system permease subunit
MAANLGTQRPGQPGSGCHPFPDRRRPAGVELHRFPLRDGPSGHASPHAGSADGGGADARHPRLDARSAAGQDYVTFAAGQGTDPTARVCSHALKNALIPTVTMAALEVGSLLGGSMIVETVFGWPGLGRVVVESIFTRNYPLIQAAILLYAVTYVLVNFLADLLYTRAQPEGAAVSARSRPVRSESPLRLSWRASRRTASPFSQALLRRGRFVCAGRPFCALDFPARPQRQPICFRRLQPPVWMEGGEWAFPLGCDGLGRDLLSRIIYGARISIFIGAVVVLIATGVGIVAGLLAGYLGGWVDSVISRVVDILLGFPYLLFAIGLMAMMGPGLQNIIIALAYKEWVIPCRLVRGETLALRTWNMSRRRAPSAHRRATSCCARFCPTSSRP